MKPTLEEVKAYFKNAKDVKNNWDETIFKITEIVQGNAYNTFMNKSTSDTVWDSKKGYAEIISYKDEPLTVSKEFILEAHKSACSTWKRKLEEQFPSVFVKDELEVGKWYKNGDAGYSNSIACVFEVSKEDKDAFSGYGFGRNGKWVEDFNFGWASYNWIPATPEEVETALINEAKKRGFEEGVKYEELHIKGRICEIKGNIKYHKSSEDLRNDGWCLFHNGKWATIIEQPAEMTVAEIEAKLGHSVKIVKG